jgi:hypothetical protein
VKTILPPVPCVRIWRATACAHRKDPVRLMSCVRRHSSAGISMACVHPTTPAKQHSMSMLPSTLTLLSTAEAICASSRTSTASVMMRRSGNWECRSLMDSKAVSGLRSHKARPEAPCSRSALAASRARVPAPPVTVDVYVSHCYVVQHYFGSVRFVPCDGVHVLIALPLTWNLYATLCAALRFSGGGRGVVNGLSAVDSTISGSCLLTSAARSSVFSGMVRFVFQCCKDRRETERLQTVMNKNRAC